MVFVLKFSKKYEFDCVQEPVGIYRQHENQLQIRNIKNQVDQMMAWYKKIKLSGEFGNEKKLIHIKNRFIFFEIIKDIEEKQYLKSLIKIIIYPNNIYKIKLFLKLVFPKKLFDRLINLTYFQIR